jgi:hypothetical protein
MDNAKHAKFVLICAVGAALGTKTQPMNKLSDEWSLSLMRLQVEKKATIK